MNILEAIEHLKNDGYIALNEDFVIPEHKKDEYLEAVEVAIGALVQDWILQSRGQSKPNNPVLVTAKIEAWQPLLGHMEVIQNE